MQMHPVRINLRQNLKLDQKMYTQYLQLNDPDLNFAVFDSRTLAETQDVQFFFTAKTCNKGCH